MVAYQVARFVFSIIPNSIFKMSCPTDTTMIIGFLALGLVSYHTNKEINFIFCEELEQYKNENDIINRINQSSIAGYFSDSSDSTDLFHEVRMIK